MYKNFQIFWSIADRQYTGDPISPKFVTKTYAISRFSAKLLSVPTSPNFGWDFYNKLVFHLLFDGAPWRLVEYLILLILVIQFIRNCCKAAHIIKKLLVISKIIIVRYSQLIFDIVGENLENKLRITHKYYLRYDDISNAYALFHVWFMQYEQKINLCPNIAESANIAENAQYR
jgi:hypothetical protein